MKKILLLFFLLMFTVSATFAANIGPEVLAQKPTVLCKVKQLPNPLFFEGWAVKTDTRQAVEFRLVQVINEYGFFLYLQDDKNFKDKPHAKWRRMIIYGDQIATYSRNLSFTATKDGKMFYQYRGGKKYEMTRVPVVSAPIKDQKKKN